MIKIGNLNRAAWQDARLFNNWGKKKTSSWSKLQVIQIQRRKKLTAFDWWMLLCTETRWRHFQVCNLQSEKCANKLWMNEINGREIRIMDILPARTVSYWNCFKLYLKKNCQLNHQKAIFKEWNETRRLKKTYFNFNRVDLQ